MKKVVSKTRFEKASKVESIQELSALYKDVTKRLRECADYRPVGNKAQDHAIETLEEELNQLQDQILKSSAKMTLRTKHDLKTLLDFWYIATVENSGDEISVSDRIIMNFRDYYDEIVFDKLIA